VHKLVCEATPIVVDADLSKYFDNIPHCQLISVSPSGIVDRDVLRRSDVASGPGEERDENGKRR